MMDMNGGLSVLDDIYVEGGSNEDKLMFYFGCVNYFFMDCYLLEVNICVDVFFCFYKDNCWGVFLLFFVGWCISQEEFM